jgi:four helix bundle protein
MDKKIGDFYDLDSWKEGRKLVILVYKSSKGFPSEERFGISDQLRRAVSSVTANIAEGFGRYHFSDKIRFYYQARGSVKEVENFLLLARDLKFLSQTIFKDMWKQSKVVEMLINGLIRSAEKQKF